MTRARDEVQCNYHQGSKRGEPVVNVKVHKLAEQGWREFYAGEPDADPRFTEEWTDEHVGEQGLDSCFWLVCSWRFEDAEEYAREVFDDPRLTVSADGRSGGWLVVSGLGDVGEWNAITLGKWWKFERYCRAEADGIMRQVVESIYINEFETWCDEQDADADRALATVAGYGDEA